MRKLMIEKRLYSLDSLFQTNEWNNLWNGFDSSAKKIREISMRRCEFLGAYVVKTDPEKNYGRTEDIYYHYKLEEGLIILNKIEVHTSMDTRPFTRCYVDEKEITVSNEMFGRSKLAREILAKLGYIVTLD